MTRRGAEIAARDGVATYRAGVLRRRLPALLLAAGVLAATLAGCGGDDPAPVAAPAPTSASPSASPSPPPPPPPPPPADPLTGITPQSTAPVVAVKIDNSPLARPFHRNLERAAVVYQELAEGGSTRFLAVYEDAADYEIGPIRSVRESDLELLEPYGPVAFGFSGGNPGVLRTVGRYRAEGKVKDVSYDVAPDLYRRAEKRKDAQNFYSSPARLAGRAPDAARPRDIGFRFGPLPASVGTPAPSAGIAFSKLSSVGFRWEPGTGRWTVLQDGRPMAAVAPTNVVIQSVDVRPTGFKDVLGNPTPYTVTIGSGPMTLLRDGKRVDGEWRRGGPALGTAFFDSTGAELPLGEGPTWVMLVPRGQQLRVG